MLTERRDAAGARAGFLFKLWANDSLEHYDPAGCLLRVVQRNGWTNTLTDLAIRLRSIAAILSARGTYP